MLKSWLKDKPVPEKDGNSEDMTPQKQHLKKTFEIILANMEETPTYNLTNQLTVGSEIGNIVVSDPSVSPRHATFILQQEVVSLIDHGSVAGTFVNGNKIPPGKYVILEDTDVVNIGDLEIRLNVKASFSAAPVEEEEAVPEIPQETKEEQPATIPRTQELIKTAKKNKGKAQKARNHHSANALVRVLSVFCDLLLSYSILVIFLPFDEFRQFLTDVPDVLLALVPAELPASLIEIGKDYSYVLTMLEDLYNFFSSTFHPGPILIIFVLNRLITTFLLGTSLSEFFLGMRYSGNGLWARFGGVLRVLLGFFTWPLFIVFDLPSLFSRRTFKEVVTFTNLQNPSSFHSLLGILLYLPLTVILTAFSPLIEGLEPPQPIYISGKIEERVKVKMPEGGENVPLQLVSDHSNKLHLDLSYSPEEVNIFNDFRFEGAQKKITLKNILVFFQYDNQRAVQLEVFKNFDFKGLLGVGIRGNVFLYDKYPELYNFVYSSEETNAAFKKKNGNKKSQFQFEVETIEFIKNAFSLSADNALDMMQEQTPLLKSFVDFKAAFLSLIEYKDYSTISFIKLGNTVFMKVSYAKQRPFDLIVPLIEGQGTVYKVSFGSKENLAAVSSKFYKYNLEESDWNSTAPQGRNNSPMTALKMFDLFSNPNFKTLVLASSTAQEIYGYYYETSASVLRKNVAAEMDVWKKIVKDTISVLETLPLKEVQEGEEDIRAKLLQNFRDLNDALLNNNTEYFGISPTTTI